MKRILLFFVVCFLCCSIYAQQTIKILSFNIHAGFNASLQEIADFINEQDPDIVALQEVDYYTVRSGREMNNEVDMLLELSKLTGTYGMFYPAIDVHNGKFGNVILSKYFFEETHREILPYIAGTEKRCAAVAKVVLKDDFVINFICTHLDMANLANGMAQISVLNRLPDENGFWLLAGDLNRRVDTPEIERLKSVWNIAVNNKFDYICFLSNNNGYTVNVKNKYVFEDVILSDHFPILTELEIIDFK